MNFYKRFYDLVKEAHKFITENVKNKIEFVNEEDVDRFQEAIHEVPFVVYVTKHGYYVEYAVLSIEPVDGDIKLNCCSKDDEGDYNSFLLNEVAGSEITWLADIISDKI